MNRILHIESLRSMIITKQYYMVGSYFVKCCLQIPTNTNKEVNEKKATCLIRHNFFLLILIRFSEQKLLQTQEIILHCTKDIFKKNKMFVCTFNQNY